MSKKKLLIITLENVNRELNSKLILSLRAIKNKNFRVIIGSKGIIWNFWKFLNPGAVFLKSFGYRYNELFDNLKKNGFTLVANDEELLLTYNYEDRINWRMNNDNIYKLDKLITVGSEDHNIVIKKFPKIKKKVIKLGNPRVELLKSPYKLLLDEKSKEIKNKFGKFIIFTTAFVRLNGGFKTEKAIDWVFARIVEDNIDPFSEEINIENKFIISQREILIRMITFIDKFENSFPDEKLMISVKPGENLKFWKNYLKKRNFKNIFLREDYEIPTNYYINASEMVISSNSTTLMEAYMLGKITINNLGSEELKSDINFLTKSSYVARSYIELNSIIKDILSQKKKFINVDDELKSTIVNASIDNDIFEKLIRELDEVVRFEYLSVYKNKKIKYYISVLNIIRNLKKYFKKFLKIKKLTFNDKMHAMKVGSKLNYNNFYDTVKHINSIENVQNLKVKQIVPQLFLLDNED